MGKPAATVLAALGIRTVFFGSPTEAADWNQWRGPGRDGLAPGFQVPASWPNELTLQWKLEVGSGHSPPVVAGDQVFVLSRREET
jgi:hypothetical protein